MLTTQLHAAPRFATSAAKPTPTPMPSWRGQGQLHVFFIFIYTEADTTRLNLDVSQQVAYTSPEV